MTAADYEKEMAVENNAADIEKERQLRIKETNHHLLKT